MLLVRKPRVALAMSLAFPQLAQSQCNPLQRSCDAVTGLNTSEYFIDFTQQSITPEHWIQANYETVTYGKDGAEYTLSKKGDAPYTWTQFYFLFGRVDVVMQAAPGVGVISSAVLMSDDLDEIDWEFSGNNFALSGGRVQTNYFGKGITGNYDRGTQPQVSDPTQAFHTYSLDWSPTQLVWLIDGIAIRTLPYSPATSGSYQYPQTPMRLHLGLWDAGDPDASQGVVQWAGGYTDLTKLPYTSYVKSVRIKTGQPCSNWVYGDKTGSYQSIQCVNNTIPITANLSFTALPTSSLPITSSISNAVSTSSINLASTTQLTRSGSNSSNPSLPGYSQIGAPSATSSALWTSEIVGGSSASIVTNISSSSLSIPNGSDMPNATPTLPSTSSIESVPLSVQAYPTIPSLTATSSSTTLVTSPSHRASDTLSKSRPHTPATTAKPSWTFFSSPFFRCHQDNCFRNLLESDNTSSNTRFCSAWLATATSPAEIPQVPARLMRACQNRFNRISSACKCLASPTNT